ncbi:foldase [Priestia megaterium]|nr:foldase [Priestia megaterium]
MVGKLKDKKILSFIAVAVIGVAIAVGTVQVKNSNVAASVNGDEISKDELYEVLMAQGGADVLDSLIEQKVITKEAAKENIKVTDKEINEELASLKASYGGEEAFDEALKSSGVKLKEVKKDLETNIKARKLVEDTIEVTEKEMKTYFDENKASFATPEQVKASHILVDDEKTAKEVKDKLDAGGDFGDLIEKYSTDTASKETEGDLGYFSEEDMVAEFSKSAFNLEVNKISDPVKTEYGYHIIKVTDKKEAADANYEKSKAAIKKTLLDNKFQTEYPTWLEKKKDEYDIKTFS